MRLRFLRTACCPLTFRISIALALVVVRPCLPRLAAEDLQVRWELSDEAGSEPFFANPNPVPTSPTPSQEPLPGPAPSATSRPPNVDPQAWQLLHRDFSDAETKSAQEFARVSDGISRLQSSLDHQVSLQQKLVEAMIRSQREAEHAKQRAELERQRMQSLLAEPPWSKEPSHRPPAASTTTEPSSDGHAEVSVPSADRELGEVAPATPQHSAISGPHELLPAPTSPVGGKETATRRSEAPHAASQERGKPETPTAVTDTALDRPRLADSLYGAGRYDLALRLYDAVSREPEFVSDQTWFYYQIAGCFRHLEDPQQAAKYYRMVAATQDSSGLSDHAKWWLANLQEHQQLAQGLASLQEMLQKTDDASLKGANP